MVALLDVEMAVQYAAEKSMLDEIKAQDESCQSWQVMIWALEFV